MTVDCFAPVLSAHEIFDPRYISLGEDSSGDLYALSAPKGIDHIEGNQLVEVNHDLDLLSMVIFPEGALWFTGGNGIFRLLIAQKQFHRIKGYKQIPMLLTELQAFGSRNSNLAKRRKAS